MTQNGPDGTYYFGSVACMVCFSCSFYGCNCSCYLASHVPSKPDLLWNDFITDDPTGQLPKKMHLPLRNRLFCFAWIRTQKRTLA